MTVTPGERGQALTLRRKNGLEKGFQVPALHKNSIEPALLQPGADLRCVAAREVVNTRQFRDIGKEMMGVTREKIYVPVEGNAKSCFRLVRRTGAIGTLRYAAPNGWRECCSISGKTRSSTARWPRCGSTCQCSGLWTS